MPDANVAAHRIPRGVCLTLWRGTTQYLNVEHVSSALPTPAPNGRRFVVHFAPDNRLYLLSLEFDDTLLSWAVPHGPTLDPATKTLANRIDNRPLERLDFEGDDPDGRGIIVIWDWGNWLCSGENTVGDAVGAGNLVFELRGSKLNGTFVLVEVMTALPGDQWLLLHEHDEYAVHGWQPENYPRSVKSGRTSGEIQLDATS
jgi:bifunctional non-homologous end joining protein LigD